MPSIILIIIAINIIYVALFTLRVILVIKGYRVFASFLSMGEVFIYLMGLTIVLDNLDNPINIAAYCIGWGLGLYLGAKIEAFLGLGYIVREVIVDSLAIQLPNKVREQGYGVTSGMADGKDGKRLVMKILAKINREQKLRSLITSFSPSAFIISYEPTQFNGGFLLKGLRTT
ncbi:DUF2179 domain-containing protein (plasmid) [Cytobacillus oceanisediminis]|uniref:DUF2179 domain-containing protein n=1 Tax=Cytobacillus oceanisediminis TaxID=665099 RepID=UPI001863FAE3|nr:DUF2179 domain-containing protein [Cytobacillus oceanisediminis]QOK29915.1 DUF2179 domain-containing protein [Cytobacillus oceanisediminis]